MIDVHKTLKRTRNTAYAYQGIIHACELVRQSSGQEHMEKFACVIDEAFYEPTSWQVGGLIPNEYLRLHPTDDPYII